MRRIVDLHIRVYLRVGVIALITLFARIDMYGAQGDVCIKFISPEAAQRFARETPRARVLAGTDAVQLFAVRVEASASLRQVQSWCVVRCDIDSEYDSLLADWRMRYDITSAAPAARFSLDKSVVRDSLRDTQWALSMLRADEVWRLSTGKGIIVGVIDTGIDWEHEDLRDQLWINTAEDRNGNSRFDPWPVSEKREGVPGDLDGEDNDGNGFTDDVIGYNFVDQRSQNLGDWSVRDPFPFDEGGHGTNVAGVIAAAHDNGKGVSGLAYNSRIMTLRAFDISGNAEEDDIASSMLYAIVNGARIINCSFGDDVFSALMYDVSRYAADCGVLIFASSGNSGSSGVHYPSDFPWIVSVGATTSRDVRAIFSSFNSQLSMVAPGQSIQTTEVGGTYTSVSGTSFSAPMASAAAAILLEVYPKLSPVGVRQIFERTATPLDTSRWSRTTGAGRIDILGALSSVGEGSCTITEPTLDKVYTRLSGQDFKIGVYGTASDPLLAEWILEVGEGTNATVWNTVVRGRESIARSGLLGFMGTHINRDTTYTLRLRILLANGREVHRSTRFRVTSSSLSIISASAEALWNGADRFLGVRVVTNRPCIARVAAKSAEVTTSASDPNVGTLHFVLIDLHGVQDSSLLLRVIVTDLNGDTSSTDVRSNAKQYRIADTALVRRAWQAPRLFMNPQSVFRTKQQFIGTDVSTSLRTLRWYARSGTQVVVRDSLQVPWFARGLGDSNGDGVQEVLTYSGGDTRLVQVDSGGHFGSVVFADTVSHTLWGSRLRDIDGDSLADIIAYRTGRTVRDSMGVLKAASDALEVWSYVRGSYKKIAEHVPTSTPAPDKSTNTFSSPGAAVGDFDGDGRTEIAYTDSDADVHICRWNGSNLETIDILETAEDAEAGSEFTTEVDINGDGIPEILSGYPSSSRRSSDGDRQPQVWTFRLIAKDSSKGFHEIWRERFYGVRYGRPYYNGVAAGPLDSKSGEEVVLSLYPNIYVFHFDSVTKRMMPLWYAGGAWSNSAMITDMDGNGKNELVFTSQNSARSEWWEWNTQYSIAAPTGFRSRRVVADSLQCAWIPVDGATAYRVQLRVVSLSGTVTSRAITTTQPVFGINLSAGDRAEYTVASMRTPVDTLSSAVSRIQVLTGADDAQLMLTSIETTSRNTIRCFFSSSVIHAALHAGSFHVVRENNQDIPVVSAVVRSDSVVDIGVIGMPGTGEMITTTVDASVSLNTFPGVRGSSWCIAPRPDTSLDGLQFSRVLNYTPTTLTVAFNLMVSESALNANAYDAPEQTGIQAVRFADSTKKNLVFEFDPTRPLGARGFVYSLTARPTVESADGHAMTKGAGSTISWVYTAERTSATYAFPQPCKLSLENSLRFAGVPRGARVVVLTAEGEEISSLSARDDDGGVLWNLTSLQGQRVPAGVYVFALVYADGTTSEKQTFIVEP